MYLQVHAIGLDAPLEISTEHMIYIKSKKGKPDLVSADDLKVGDVLVSDLSQVTTSDDFTIYSIVSVRRTGIYAPLTFAGNIVVNGVVASNYVTLTGLPNVPMESRGDCTTACCMSLQNKQVSWRNIQRRRFSNVD
jgi:hypothetical protein